MNSLPIGFEKLKTEKPYVNLSKLPEGEHKFRIVQRPIAGWIDWKDKKPYRYRPENKPAASFDPAVPMKPFWALHVWDYSKEGLFVMEITQNSIRKALENYALNEDWGDLTSYDIKIKKEGSGKDTAYTVIPIPPKPVSDKIKKATETTRIRLEALYEGKDPWNDLDATVDVSTGEITHPGKLTPEQEAKLDTLILEIDKKYVEKVNKTLGIKEIYDMPAKEFERTVRHFETLIKVKEGSRGETASVA